jgi:hypothetical protein
MFQTALCHGGTKTYEKQKFSRIEHEKVEHEKTEHEKTFDKRSEEDINTDEIESPVFKDQKWDSSSIEIITCLQTCKEEGTCVIPFPVVRRCVLCSTGATNIG